MIFLRSNEGCSTYVEKEVPSSYIPSDLFAWSAAVLADLSIWHILILVAVITLMFGTKRIPEIGASIGKGIQAFKRGLSDATAIDDTSSTPPPAKPALPPAGGAPKRLSE
jgi:sec-independent protein translocase protein TatA